MPKSISSLNSLFTANDCVVLNVRQI